jgi:hypothetical protein
MAGFSSGGLGAVLGVLFLGYLLYRQVQVRQLPRQLRLERSLMFVAIGVLTSLPILQGHVRASGAVWGFVAVRYVVGAAHAAARAFTVRLWSVDRKLHRQGTVWTVALWLVSVLTHIGAGFLTRSLGGPATLESSTAMLYLAVASIVQQVVLVERGNRYRTRARAALGLGQR